MMKSLVSRFKAFALLAVVAACAMPSLVQAEYVAGWDFSSLAKQQWETSAGTAIALDGSAPHTWTSMPENEYVFTVDFTVDALPVAAGTIASWKMADNYEIAFVKSATTDGSANLYLAWGYWAGDKVSNDWTTYLSAGQYTAWTADTSSHSFRIEYDHSNLTGKIRGTRVFMDGVKICDVDGLRFANKAVQGLVFGGCSGSKGQETWPNSTATFSNVTYSSGTSLQDDAILTSNGYTLKLNGCILNADGSVSVIGTTGLSVEFADGDGFYNSKAITAVIEMSSLPTSGTVVDYKQDDGNGGRHVGVSIKSATKLAQSWGNALNSTSWNQGYNDIDCSTLGGKHAVAFAYNGAWVGGQTFVDGSAGCNNNDGLYDSSHNLRKLYVGSLNGTSAAALGMRVYSIKLYTTKLDASGAAAAASDVILSDGCSAAFSSGATYKYCGSDFTNGFTIDLAGQTVALGTYPGTSGTITVNDSVGGGSATMTLPEGFTGSFAGTGKLSVTAPASILPVSGGMDLSGKTVTIPNASGTIIAANSITVGNSGLQISYTESQPLSVMMKVGNIPSVASSIVGLAMSGLNTQSQQTDVEIVASRTTTGFQNGWLNTSGTFAVNNGTGWGAASVNTVDSSTDHWFTYTFQHNSGGTKAYLDGSAVAAGSGDNGLRWEGIPLTVLTLGGSSFSTTALAPTTGMVIKQVSVFQTELSYLQVAKITTALNNGWTVGTAGTTLTSDEDGSSLPGYSNVTAVGTVTVASDGTLNFSGLTAIQVGNGATFDVSAITGLSQVVVLPGGELTIGKQRPSSVAVLEGGTLNVSSNDPTVNDLIVGYTPIVELSILDSSYFNGTVKLDNVTVTPSIEGTTATLTGVAVAGNATYTGSGWWWDYEFTGNGNNIGSEGAELQWDGDRPLQGAEYTTADATGNQMLHLPARPWRNVTAYPSEFTAVMFCKAGSTANGVLVSFGSTGYGTEKKTITLSTGTNPSAGDMRLVYGVAQSSSTDLVKGGFTLDNITSANHLYAFTVQTVGGVSQITVYADGDLLTTYAADSVITLDSGFQIASGHGGVPSGLSRLADDDAATMDFLRVSNVALSEAAIKALAAEYRYVSPNGIAERTLSADATWTDSTNNSWSQKTLNEDGSTTTTEQAAPNSGTVVEITATTDVQLTMDLSSEVSYEKLTFQGDGAITVKAGGAGTVAPTVTTRTYINTDVTMDVAAFASLGAITVAAGKTLTLVPDETSTLTTGIGLGIRGTASSIVTGTVTLGTGAQVALLDSMVTSFASYGFTLTLTPDASSRYVYTIARNDNPVYITKTDGVGTRVTYAMYPDAMSSMSAMFTLPEEPTTIPEDFASSVTIVNNHASESLTVATVFAGGTVPVTVLSGPSPVVLSGNSMFGGTVTLNGATTLSGSVTINSTLAGSADVTISGTVSVANGVTYGKALNGTGTLDFSGWSTLPDVTLTFGTWSGTVKLPGFSAASNGVNLEKYGAAISGATIALNGITGGWLTSPYTTISSTLQLDGDVNLTDFSPRDYTFAKITGTHDMKFGNGGDVPTTLAITEISDYSGTVYNTSSTRLTIGTLKLSSAPSAGDRILPTAGTGDIAVSTVSVGGSSQTMVLEQRKNVDQPGIYVVATTTSDTAGDTPVTVLEPEAGTTSIDIRGSAISGKVAIPGTVTQITGVVVDNLLLKVTYTPTGESATTAYYAGILSLDGSGNVSLNGAGEVAGVSVAPALDTTDTPMAVDSGAPQFAVKTIPGLWYTVHEGSAPDSLSATGTPVQATSATTSVAGTAPADAVKVKYYKVAVGVTEAASQDTE